ncbi:4Fe-4S binding protein [Dehalobacter sp. DCM]|uniref:4Fe-4S binding protein n=1 Tax=Dehalobacter sp. DCM TaxID=2907827 RepID=UPI0030813A85|nr:4Fe-4S binding protein [Dehalobacter sp. DCM]
MLKVENLTPTEIEENYVTLRDRMNALSFGYCPTESGIEFVLLKRFFTPEDVAYWLEMETDTYFTAQRYAEITGLPLEKASSVLEDMSHRGLLYRVRRGGRAEYYVVPVAHGVYEFNLNHLDEKEWTMGLAGHFGQGMLQQVYDVNIPFYRSVPINMDVVKGSEVYPYDDIVKQVKQYSVFGVSNCTCRHLNKTVGAPDMGFDMETCITCGEMAEFYLENGIAREITVDDVLAILKRSTEKGMVIQCVYSKNSEIICSCHVDGCGILQAAKVFGGSATKKISNYTLEQNRDACISCGKCVVRCPMHAITMDAENKPVTDSSCVSCGQCVSVCPVQAKVLVKKESVEIIPDSIFDTYISMQEYRKSEGNLSKK